MHTGRAVHQEAHIPGQLGAQPVGFDIAHVRHAQSERVAGRGAAALFPLVQAEKGLQAPRQGGVCVHAARRTRSARPHARARSVQAHIRRGCPQLHLARQHQARKHLAAKVSVLLLGFKTFKTIKLNNFYLHKTTL